MVVLNEYASELEMDIAELIHTNSVLRIVVETIYEADADFYEMFC